MTNVCPGPVRTAVAENALLSDGSTNNKKDPLIEGGMTVQRSAQCVQIVCGNINYKIIYSSFGNGCLRGS